MPVDTTQHQIRTKDTLSIPSNRFNPSCLNTGVSRQVFKGLDMKKIPLSKGKFALVDDEDSGWLSEWQWYVHKEGTSYYAVRSNKGGTPKWIRMHRSVMDTPKGTYIDHVNGDGLDNRRKNLRFCNDSQNSMNRSLSSRNTSGYKGVSLNKETGKYVAKITLNHKIIYLGSFDCKHVASEIYDKKALELFGEFARTNKKMKLNSLKDGE